MQPLSNLLHEIMTSVFSVYPIKQKHSFRKQKQTQGSDVFLGFPQRLFVKLKCKEYQF